MDTGEIGGETIFTQRDSQESLPNRVLAYFRPGTQRSLQHAREHNGVMLVCTRWQCWHELLRSTNHSR